MKQLELSSGRLTSLSRLLLFLDKNPAVDAFMACESLVRIRSIQSQQLASDALQAATTLGLISDLEGIWQLTHSGKSIVLSTKDEYGLALQRRLLLKIILSSRRDLLWTAFADSNELRATTPDLHQILQELKLLDSKPSSEAESFWSDMRKAELRFNDALLKKIGDQAESWSMFFEAKRLSELGHLDLAREISWLSRESDLHGYDILSFSGVGDSPRARRHIEVKRSRFVSNEFLEFHLSRNEFIQSMALGQKYRFHLWWKDIRKDGINLSEVSSESIANLVPKNQDAFSYWTECVIRCSLKDALTTHRDVQVRN
jgi:hypothetical protein